MLRVLAWVKETGHPGATIAWRPAGD
jgi:hypothetical protein